MKDRKLGELVMELETWVDFNSKSSIHLLDVSKLLTLLRRYYDIKELKEGKGK